MTALRATESDAPVTPATPPASVRRAGAARRQGTAAGQARRSLQRDLARREASLRISRRASGPAGGLQRPASGPIANPQPAPPLPTQVPVGRRTAAEPVVAPRQPLPTRPAAPRVEPQPQPRARQTQARPAQPVRRQPAPSGGSASAPYGVTAVATAPATAAAIAAPAPRPITQPAPSRPFVVLPGSAPEAIPGARRRLSTSAVVISALITIVLTIGVIVAAQIRVTQMNEQIGSDLAATSQLQQVTTGLQERISALVTTARIDHEAARRQLIEPDPVDVTYLSTGDRAQTADRAARMLREQPLNPAGGPRSTATAPSSASTTATPAAPSTTAATTTGTTTAATTTATTTP